MRRVIHSGSILVALALALAGATCSPSQTGNTSTTLTDEETRQQAVIIASETPGQLSHFTVTGKNADFGRYVALGEATFIAGQEEGVLRSGTGIAVLNAESGQQIVADVTCQVFGDGSEFTFHWRDSVVFSNGSIVSTTGTFVDQKPPGLALNRTQLSAVYFDGLCCVYCCGGGTCSQYCGFCGGPVPQCPKGTTKLR